MSIMQWKRPKDFFGPDDYDGTETVAECERRIRANQAAWDKEFADLPFWKRVLARLGF